MNTRQLAVWGGLLATLVACYWVSAREEATPELTLPEEAAPEIVLQTPNKPSESAQSAQNQAGNISLVSHRNQSNTQNNHQQFTLRAVDAAPPVDLFAPLPAAAAADAASANVAQAPAAPANPYSYAGKLEEEGVLHVFLTDGSTNFAAKAGDELQGGWRVKRIEQDAVLLVYQPLKYEVKLEFGASL